jgi:hypothetical protein
MYVALFNIYTLEVIRDEVRKYEVTLAPYSNPVFFDRVTFIRLLIGPSSSIRLLIGREFHHFHKS